jgi:hypothetical protein
MKRFYFVFPFAVLGFGRASGTGGVWAGVTKPNKKDVSFIISDLSSNDCCLEGILWRF